jgi:hypothetical protein
LGNQQRGEIGCRVILPEDRLVLALGAEVAGEALAQASAVVADAAAGAVAALLVAIAEEHIWARGALLERAVGAAEAEIAHAADGLHRVPGRVVCHVRLHRELLLGVADAAARAVVRAYSALARDALVVLEARTFARLTVTEALVGAFDLWVGLVGRNRNRHPRCGLGASPGRAVVVCERQVTCKRGATRCEQICGRDGNSVHSKKVNRNYHPVMIDFTVWAKIAGAFVVGTAAAVAGAAVGAIRRSKRDQAAREQEEAGSHCRY